MSETDYNPIACALHDQYEIAIMQRKVMHIEWRDEQGTMHEADVLPLDIRVSAGEEFLVVRRNGPGEDADRFEIRLDRIIGIKA